MSVITFLSDYGYNDEFVGVCHGVLAMWCPQAQVIDITHGIARHDIRAGAVALRGAVTYMPPGVHLAVVDPDVGMPRRAVALRTAARNHLLVGPDNGLLALAAERLGGVVEAVDIGASPYRLDPVCATFHGRDIFAPVAAALAGGAQLSGVGEPFAPADLVGLDLPRSRVEDDGTLVAQVRAIDRFGNTQLNVDHAELASFGVAHGVAVRIEVVDGVFAARSVSAFGEGAPDELLVYEDAQQQLAIAINRGSASERLDLGLDSEVRLRLT